MQRNPHNIMDSDTASGRRLIAAIICQAKDDLEIKDDAKAPKLQHKKDAIDFFWGSNSKTSDAYLILLDYNPVEFKAKLKALFEEGKLSAVTA